LSTYYFKLSAIGFFVKHNVVLTTIHNFPTGIQRQGSSICYSTDDNKFLSEIIPDSVTYKEFDGLYPYAMKRTTTKDSETLLLHTLRLSKVDVQLVFVPKDILGLYLAKIFIHQYFSSINTSVENPLKPFFKNTKEIDQEMILD
jgi:hypothetical protein